MCTLDSTVSAYTPAPSLFPQAFGVGSRLTEVADDAKVFRLVDELVTRDKTDDVDRVPQLIVTILVAFAVELEVGESIGVSSIASSASTYFPWTDASCLRLNPS